MSDTKILTIYTQILMDGSRNSTKTSIDLRGVSRKNQVYETFINETNSLLKDVQL
jgi:hypothetical protein